MQAAIRWPGVSHFLCLSFNIYKMGLEGQKERILVDNPVCDSIPTEPESKNQRGLWLFFVVGFF